MPGASLPLTSTGAYTKPTSLSMSAGLQIGSTGGSDISAVNYRGVGLGFYSSANGTNASQNGFTNFRGLVLETNGTLALVNTTGNSENIISSVAWPTGTLGAFSTSINYVVSYQVNTTLANGGISSISVTNPSTSVTDTADFASIGAYAGANFFTPTNTAFAGIMDTGNGGVGFISNLQVGSVLPVTGSIWTGASNSTVWADPGNWNGGVPGATSGTTSQDTAVFNSNPTFNAPVVDANRNIQNVTFDTANVGAIVLGTTGGNALLLTTGGVIQTTSTVTNAETINAPLVLETPGGFYTFTSNAASTSATLNFGGGITSGANSGTTTLTLNGTNTGANTISGAIGNGVSGATVALLVQNGNWTLSAPNTYTGATTITGGTLNVGSGSLGASPVVLSGGTFNLTGSAASPTITVSGGAMNVNGGGTLGAPNIAISNGSLTIGSGGTIGAAPIAVTGTGTFAVTGGAVGNIAATVSGTGIFAVQPGSGTISLGSTGAGSSGASVSLASGGAFSMVDGAIGVANLNQQNSFSGPGLTLNGAKLNFDLSSTGADQLNVGAAPVSVSGANTIGINPVGSSLTLGSTYKLIGAPAGGLSGNFQFAGGGTSTSVQVGPSNVYSLSLTNLPTAQFLSVANASATSVAVIHDTFSGSSGTSIAGQQPSPVNLPGGTYTNFGSQQGASYTGSNSVNMNIDSGIVVPISSAGSYVKTATMTISAGLQINTLTGSDLGSGSAFRGLGVGFFDSGSGAGSNAFTGFSGVVLNVNGTVTLSQAPSATNVETNYVSYIAWPSATLGAFSTSIPYVFTYTVNTAAANGGISNFSVTNPNTSVTDSADFAAINNYSGTNIFTDSSTTFAGFMSTATFPPGTNGFVSNFQLNQVSFTTIGSVWTGGNNSTTWSDPLNWNGAVPGATSGTSNTDTAIFNANPTFNAPVVDAGRNLQFITFDTSSVGALTLGTTNGNPLLLTNFGTIQTTSSVTNPQVVNAPLVLEGTNGFYKFTTGSSTSAATLSFGGAISAGGGSGTTTLVLNGTNTGNNTINGAISNGGSGATMALVVQGGNWIFGGANTYTGSTSVGSGTLRVGNGTSGSPSPTPISVYAGSLVLAGPAASPASSLSVTDRLEFRGGTFVLASGGTLGNIPVAVQSGGSFAALTGSGTLSAGSTGAGSSGATLSLASGTTFSMVDGAAGTFNLQQQNSFAGNPAFSVNGATLNFDLGSTGPDKLVVGAGTASVSGTNTIGITPFGSSLTPGNYSLISAPAGGLTGNFQFANGGTTQFVSAGGNTYQLQLSNTSTTQKLTVNATATSITPIIQDNFSGSGNVSGRTPDTVNLPGGTYSQFGSLQNGTISGNTVQVGADNGVFIPLKTLSFTPPTQMKVSAGMQTGSIGTSNGDVALRGVGAGFYTSSAPGSNADTYFTGLVLNPTAAGTGAVIFGQSLVPSQGNEVALVTVPWNASITAALGAFSPSTTYTISYTINTTVANGGISNVSVSNGSATDTADFASIDAYNLANPFAPAGTTNNAGFFGSGNGGGQTGYVGRL